MRSLFLVFGALFLGLTVAGSSLAADSMVCPSRIKVTSGQVHLKTVEKGYRPFVAQSMLNLEDVSLYHGLPEQGVSLEPNEDAALEASQSSDGGKSRIWVFDQSDREEKWFSCEYSGWVVQLVRKIDGFATRCTATLVKTKPYGALEGKLDCQ